MICEKCKTKPVARGVKDITCFKCGNKETINVAFFDICKKCSDKFQICEYCGEKMFKENDDDSMEKIVKLIPAFDKRNSDPRKDYGIHGVNLVMILKGIKGSIEFIIYTNWELDHVSKELDLEIQHSNKNLSCLYRPMPLSIKYHSLKPINEENFYSKSCKYLDNNSCYSGEFGFESGDEVYNILLEQGDEGVWKELQKYYEKIFGKSGETI